MFLNVCVYVFIKGEIWTQRYIRISCEDKGKYRVDASKAKGHQRLLATHQYKEAGTNFLPHSLQKELTLPTPRLPDSRTVRK
jgi:hypothetical protein